MNLIFVVVEWDTCEFLCDKELEGDMVGNKTTINNNVESLHEEKHNITYDSINQNCMPDAHNLTESISIETNYNPDNENLDQAETHDTSYYVIEEPCAIVNEFDESNDGDNIADFDTYDQPVCSQDLKLIPQTTKNVEKRQIAPKYFTKNREIVRKRRKRNYRGLQRKLYHCAHCGSYAKLIKMQIEVLKAQKQKLLQETHILQLTKEKLLYDVRELEQKQ